MAGKNSGNAGTNIVLPVFAIQNGRNRYDTMVIIQYGMNNIGKGIAYPVISRAFKIVDLHAGIFRLSCDFVELQMAKSLWMLRQDVQDRFAAYRNM